MSNIFIRDILGTVDFAVPEDDADLATATTELDALLTTVADFRYDAVIAWVETQDGGSAPRTLNCLCQSFEYDTGGGTWVDCPSTAQTQTLTTNIYNKLMGDFNINGVGDQQVSLYQLSSVQPWIRDPGGFVYPTDTGDDVYVGGATPNGVWFADGDMVLGGAARAGLEVLRVVGPARIEGDLVLDEQSAHSTAPAAGKGILWVRDDTPNVLVFTDDAGTDTVLGAGGGSSPWTDGGTVLYPTSDEDVAIGDTAVSGNERLLVVNKNVATGSHVAVIGAVTTPGVAGTVTSWVGVQAAAQVGNDTITDAKFLHVASPAGTGGITTATGLHIDDIDGGGPTVGTPFGIYQAGTSDVNAFLGKMALGASAMVGTERLRVVGDIRVESLLYLPSLTSTIVVGASAGSGSGENIRTVSDTNSGNNIGIRADFNDTSGVSLGFTGFNARMQGATGFSGTFVGFGVDPSGGGAGWSHIGFEFPDMAGTNLQGSEAFVQSGATESSRFEGRVGVGMNYRSSTTLQVGVPSNGFTTPWKSVVIAREGDNTTSSPGSSSDWYGMEVSLTQNSGGAASARYIQNLRYVNTVAPTAPVTRPLTIQNAYGLYINDWTGGANVSFTNTPYGIYQAGSSDRNYFAGQIGVGTSAPSSSAAIEISSTTRALVVSQMTSTERDALAAVLGMIIYNTTTGKYEGCTAAGTPGTWAAFH